MARPQNTSELAAEQCKTNAFLRAELDNTLAKIFERWTVSETTDQREALHAEYSALRKFKAELYAKCERITNGEPV